MSFWFIGISLVSILFSSELTAKLGFKTSVKQIDTIEELVNSNLKLIIFDGIESYHNLDPILFKRIRNKAESDKTLIFFAQYFNEKWINGTANKENAIFNFEVPIKVIISKASKMLGNKCRFRYLAEDFGVSTSLTIGSSMRLNKVFRDELNLRFVNNNSHNHH